jgi:hypothetical protein
MSQHETLTQIALTRLTVKSEVTVIIPMSSAGKEVAMKLHQSIADTVTKHLISERNLILVSSDTKSEEVKGTI